MTSIEFKDVSFFYQEAQPVLNNVSFTVGSGESVGLIGANGAGKSTMMKLMLGLLSGSGSIRINGTELTAKTLNAIRRDVGYVLQNSDNQMFMPTVYDDMLFGPMNYGQSRRETDREIDRILETLNITQLKNRYNHCISGGEKKMAAIATILMMKPSVILMDEPTTALDPVNRRTVIDTINSLPQTKLIASHDLDMILNCCDRVILLSRGEIAADGPARTILRDRQLLEKHRMELPLCLQEFRPRS